MTDLLEQTTTIVEHQLDNGDKDKFAHYVSKTAILEAAVNGVPAEALCGKLWFPNANPDNYQVCPECEEAFKDDERFED